MLELASDPLLFRRQVHGLIYYLTTLGFIDGELNPAEMTWVLEAIRSFVELRVDTKGLDGELRDDVIADMVQDFEAFFEEARREVAALLEASVDEGDGQEAFFNEKLKQRCFELFETFEPEQQIRLISIADDLLLADGAAHPAEVRFREELAARLGSQAPILLLPDPIPRRVEVRELDQRSWSELDHPIFAEVEQHYAQDDQELARQLEGDQALMAEALRIFAEKRSAGAGRLEAALNVDDLEAGASFLDEYVYVVQPEPDSEFEVTVLGDLHGCYSCLKAALAQSRFLEKVEAWAADPSGPMPKLVLLGDYLDRGYFSFEGTLRLALKLLVAYPEHVHLLRGNHEFYHEYEGEIVSTVMPAEAIGRLRKVAPEAFFASARQLFDELPCLLLLGRMVLVHGGVPIDAVTREKVTSLAGLNDWEVRFQMLWSDPTTVDLMPKALQETTYRFGYGRLQCLSFLERLRCHTLIRGHEHLETGFSRDFNDERLLALTVVSAGGEHNADLPEEADLRMVRPMALTITTSGDRDQSSLIEAWPIDYAAFNAPERNGFFSHEPGVPFEEP